MRAASGRDRLRAHAGLGNPGRAHGTYQFDMEAAVAPDPLVAEMERTGQEWNLAALAPRLGTRPVLLIGTSRDSLTRYAAHH